MTENEETILEIFPGRLLNIIEGDDNKWVYTINYLVRMKILPYY
jgi:hypothetical protein